MRAHVTQETPAIKAQSAAIAIAMASICNAEGGRFLSHPKGRTVAGRPAALRARCVPQAHGLARALPRNPLQLTPADALAAGDWARITRLAEEASFLRIG